MKYTNKLLITIYLALAFFNQPLSAAEDNADASAFKGLNIGLGLSLTKTNQDYSENSPFNFNYKATNVIPKIDVSYLFQLDSKWLIGFGGTYDLLHAKSDIYALPASFAYAPGTTQYTSKNHYSLYIEPTYAIDESTALFAKLSYESIHVDSLWVCHGLSGGINDHMKLNGIGYGLGAKKLLTPNVYVQAEVEYINYSDQNYADSTGTWGYHNNKSYSGVATVGYKF
ncbi:MAG: outer membrane beta-barrel protein [Methylophilaceae bacterium]